MQSANYACTRVRAALIGRAGFLEKGFMGPYGVGDPSTFTTSDTTSSDGGTLAVIAHQVITDTLRKAEQTTPIIGKALS